MRKKMFFYIVISFLVVIAVVFGINFYLNQKKNKKDKEIIGDYTPIETNIFSTGNGCFEVNWFTNKETIGYIKYGLSEENISIAAQDKNGMIISQSHKVTVCNLEENRTYYVIVVSNGVPYDLNGTPLKVDL